jgi:hypothetical protein
MGLFDFLVKKFVLNEAQDNVSQGKQNNLSPNDQLDYLLENGEYEEYIHTLGDYFDLYSQIDIVRNLQDEILLKKIATCGLDQYVSHAAIMQIQDVNFLMEIITSNPWNSSETGNVAILRLVDFEVTEEVRTFLDNIKADKKYERGIRNIAKALSENPQLVRDVKAETFIPRYEAEPKRWSFDVSQRRSIIE